MTSLALTRCEPREPAETTLTRCSDCSETVDVSDALNLGDVSYCPGECSFLAAADRYYALDGVVKGSEALALASVFAGLSASLLRGVVQAAKGDLIALAAVNQAAFRAMRDLSKAEHSALLGIEEACGRKDSREARYARAFLAGDLEALTAIVAEPVDARVHPAGGSRSAGSVMEKMP